MNRSQLELVIQITAQSAVAAAALEAFRNTVGVTVKEIAEGNDGITATVVGTEAAIQRAALQAEAMGASLEEVSRRAAEATARVGMFSPEMFRAYAATQLLSRELGIPIPFALARIIGQMSSIGPIVSGAFGIIVGGFVVQALFEITGKVTEFLTQTKEAEKAWKAVNVQIGRSYDELERLNDEDLRVRREETEVGKDAVETARLKAIYAQSDVTFAKDAAEAKRRELADAQKTLQTLQQQRELLESTGGPGLGSRALVERMSGISSGALAIQESKVAQLGAEYEVLKAKIRNAGDEAVLAAQRAVEAQTKADEKAEKAGEKQASAEERYAERRKQYLDRFAADAATYAETGGRYVEAINRRIEEGQRKALELSKEQARFAAEVTKQIERQGEETERALDRDLKKVEEVSAKAKEAEDKGGRPIRGRKDQGRDIAEDLALSDVARQKAAAEQVTEAENRKIQAHQKEQLAALAQAVSDARAVQQIIQGQVTLALVYGTTSQQYIAALNAEMAAEKQYAQVVWDSQQAVMNIRKLAASQALQVANAQKAANDAATASGLEGVTHQVAGLLSLIGARREAAGIEGAWETAKAFQDLGDYDFWGAAQHFISAAQYFIVAGRGSGHSGRGGSGGGGAAGGRSGGSSGSGNSLPGFETVVSGGPESASTRVVPTGGAPRGNLTIAVMGDRESAQWVVGKLHQAVNNGAAMPAQTVPSPVTPGLARR